MLHNTHLFHIRGTRVTILKCHRRVVGGIFATVMDYFWREDTPWLILQLPDGQRATAPAHWTDLPGDTFPSTRDRPLLLAKALPPRAQRCRQLRPTRPTQGRAPYYLKPG